MTGDSGKPMATTSVCLSVCLSVELIVESEDGNEDVVKQSDV